MRISDWSSDVCSSDLVRCPRGTGAARAAAMGRRVVTPALVIILPADLDDAPEWLRVTGDAIVARGRGEAWGTPPDDPGAILLVAPAAALPLHRTALPAHPARQLGREQCRERAGN